MSPSLAVRNLVHQKTRTLIGVTGVAFASLFIFMQLGFRGSAEATATLLLDKLNDFDIVLVSPDYLNLNRTGAFPRDRLYQARSVAGVAQAYPLYLSFHFWRNPYTGLRRNIWLIGFNPADPVFPGLSELTDASLRQRLQQPDTVLVDRLSHPDFGLREGVLLDGSTVTELGGRQVEIVGRFTLGSGFASDGAVITSDQTFARILGGPVLEHVPLGLVKLQHGADPHSVQQALRRQLPADVQVRLRSELEKQEKAFWLDDKPLGILFTFGVVVAFFVGVVFVYQIVSSDIRNLQAEYATLKAIGYSEGYLSRVVLNQTLLLALLGYLPGLASALGLYLVTRELARIPIYMSVGRAAGVFALTLLMCSLSALFALRKVRSADPADLF